MKKRRNYYIPVDGKLYETSQEVYETYYKMDRRERYLAERSKAHDISYDALVEADYPIEERLVVQPISLEDQVLKEFQVEELLEILSILSRYEMWLVEEIYMHGKSERQIERDSGIPRKTISYQKKKMLEKLKTHMKL